MTSRERPHRDKAEPTCADEAARTPDEPAAGAPSPDAPSPEAPSDDLERARASSFAHRIEAVMAGRDLPPVMAPEERALVDVAGAIRAGVVGGELDGARAGELIDRALAEARAGDRRAGGGALAEVTASAPAAAASADTAPAEPENRPTDRATEADPARAGRSRPARTLSPYLAAAALAAAGLALWLGPNMSGPPSEAPTLPEEATSRPADALIGEIPHERAGDARARTEAIFEDRLRGYRSLTFDGAGSEER